MPEGLFKVFCTSAFAGVEALDADYLLKSTALPRPPDGLNHGRALQEASETAAGIGGPAPGGPLVAYKDDFNGPETGIQDLKGPLPRSLMFEFRHISLAPPRTSMLLTLSPMVIMPGRCSPFRRRF